MAIINASAAAAQRRRFIGHADKLWEAAKSMAGAVRCRLSIAHAGKRWEAAKDYWDILRPMRFCVFVWVGITLLITAVPQSQDALLALFENVFPELPADSLLVWLRSLLDYPSELLPTLIGALLATLWGSWHLILFAAAALFWAWQTFYWARFASRLPARPRRHQIYSSPDNPPILSDDEIAALNERVPRRLGGLVLVSVWAALVLANLENTTQRVLYDLLFAGLSGLVAFFFAYRRGRIRFVLFAVWVALVVWVVATDGTPLNPLYQIMASAMMVALFFVYWRIVRGRRGFANAIGQKLPRFHFRAFPNFTRDLAHIDPSPRVKRLTLALLIATLTIFLASAFWRLPTGVATAVAIVWMAFGLWAAGELGGVPPGTKGALRLNILLFSILFLVSIDPDPPIIRWLSYLHSPTIIMSVAALWVFVGTFCLAVPGEILGLPITSTVVLFAIVASFIGRYDNHNLRLTDQAWSQLPLGDALNNWWNDVPKPDDEKEPVQLVLVATAGGASRAAYWTADVLAQIEKDHPGFHKHIFAISSVSGGSLGAVVYRTMLNEIINDNTPKAGDEWDEYCQHDGKATKKNMLHCGLSAIDHDFLGPTFLTGLYADMTQRFLPGSLLPDRASALERSWEQAWRRTMPNSSEGIGLDVPFHSLWKPKTWLPALIINGTSEKTGRRIITSNLLIGEESFIDALGYFEEVKPQYDIRVSTAAHNSARFPYIDAAGTLTTAESGMTDRIVDGGYFENFGAGSLYDLLRALDKIKGQNRKIKFFVIQITSDPTLETNRPARDDVWRKKSGLALNVASDLTAPPVSLFDTGSALGYRATQILKTSVNAMGEAKDGENQYYAEFRLSNKDATMSWVLSRKSVQALDDEWESETNKPEYDRLKKFMKWNSEAP